MHQRADAHTSAHSSDKLYFWIVSQVISQYRTEIRFVPGRELTGDKHNTRLVGGSDYIQKRNWGAAGCLKIDAISRSNVAQVMVARLPA